MTTDTTDSSTTVTDNRDSTATMTTDTTDSATTVTDNIETAQLQ